MQIRTTKVERETFNKCELSEEEQKEFDWDAMGEHVYFRYNGNVYCDAEFEVVLDLFDKKDWDGYSAQTFFSGVLVKFSSDMERVIVGDYCV